MINVEIVPISEWISTISTNVCNLHFNVFTTNFYYILNLLYLIATNTTNQIWYNKIMIILDTCIHIHFSPLKAIFSGANTIGWKEEAMKEVVERSVPRTSGLHRDACREHCSPLSLSLSLPVRARGESWIYEWTKRRASVGSPTRFIIIGTS